MSRICAITGKRPSKGGRIIRKGLTKKSGGIGTSLVKNTRRKFRPNVQRIRVKLPSGEVKRMRVSVKAIKAGKITTACTKKTLYQKNTNVLKTRALSPV